MPVQNRIQSKVEITVPEPHPKHKSQRKDQFDKLMSDMNRFEAKIMNSFLAEDAEHNGLEKEPNPSQNKRMRKSNSVEHTNEENHTFSSEQHETMNK